MRLSHVLTSTAAMTIAAVPVAAHAQVDGVADHEACADGNTVARVPGSLLAQPVFGRGPAQVGTLATQVPADHIVVEAGGRQFTAVATEDGSLVVATLAPVSQLVVCDQPARPVEVRGEVLINPDNEPEASPTPEPTPIQVPAPAPTDDAQEPDPEPTPTPTPAPTAGPAQPAPPVTTPPVDAPEPPALPVETPDAPSQDGDTEPPVAAREPEDVPVPIQPPAPDDGPDPDPPVDPTAPPAIVPEQPRLPEPAPEAIEPDGDDPQGDQADAEPEDEVVTLDVIQPDVDDEDDDFDAYVEGLLAWVPASEDEPDDEDDPQGDDDAPGAEVDDVVEEPEPLLLHVGDDGEAEEMATPLFLTVGDDLPDEAEAAPAARALPTRDRDGSRGTGVARQAMFGLVTLAGTQGSLSTPPASWSFA